MKMHAQLGVCKLLEAYDNVTIPIAITDAHFLARKIKFT